MSTPLPVVPSSAAAAEKYLTVSLAGETYGIAVLKVREIVRLQKITPVPQMPSYVKGVLNLRGRVIPIVDLRVKFGMPAAFDDRTCVVVVQVARPQGAALTLGLLVDAVDDVAKIGDRDLQGTPEFGVRVDTTYLRGLAKVKNTVVMLLDIERVVTPDALDTIAAA